MSAYVLTWDRKVDRKVVDRKEDRKTSRILSYTEERTRNSNGGGKEYARSLVKSLPVW